LLADGDLVSLPNINGVRQEIINHNHIPAFVNCHEVSNQYERIRQRTNNNLVNRTNTIFKQHSLIKCDTKHIKTFNYMGSLLCVDFQVLKLANL
jgi:hypothetical protein